MTFTCVSAGVHIPAHVSQQDTMPPYEGIELADERHPFISPVKLSSTKLYRQAETGRLKQSTEDNFTANLICTLGVVCEKIRLLPFSFDIVAGHLDRVRLKAPIAEVSPVTITCEPPEPKDPIPIPALEGGPALLALPAPLASPLGADEEVLDMLDDLENDLDMLDDLETDFAQTAETIDFAENAEVRTS